MALTGIHHVAIVVADLDDAATRYSRVLGSEPVKIRDVPQSKLTLAFYAVGDSFIELICPYGEDDSYDFPGFLARRGEAIHHVAVDVDDLDESISALKRREVCLLSDEPTVGPDDRIVFVAEEMLNGVSLELVERTS